MPFDGGMPVSWTGVAFAQIDWFALTEPTDSGTFTTMVRLLDVAGLPVMQVAFEVSTQVTASLLTGI